MSRLSVKAAVEAWPLAEPFVISRGARTEAHVVVVEVDDGRHRGRGECVPYARYGETVDSVIAAIEEVAATVGVTDRTALQRALSPGAARNALDCALWDLEAKAAGKPAHALAGVAPPGQVTTCYTLSLGTPAAMAAKARAVAHLPLLKLKLGGGDADVARMRSVRVARPDARLVADANESWRPDDLARLLQAASECAFELVEQPLPAGEDDILASVEHLVLICADESAHVTGDLAALASRYDAVNIKLDKAGGLTEALAMAAEARRLGLDIMAGCMVGTSLAMAPAMLVAQGARWVDLDAPLLLARDRPGGLRYDGAIAYPPATELWG